MMNRIESLRKCAEDIAANADKLLDGTSDYQTLDVVIKFNGDKVTAIEVNHYWTPEEIEKRRREFE